MEIIKLGLTGNFAAINPPLWLARDLSVLANTRPDFRLLLLFADDLPAYNQVARRAASPAELEQRSEALEGLCNQHFRAGTGPSSSSCDLAVRTRLGISIFNFIGLEGRETTSRLTGLPVKLPILQTPPSTAVFILPPRHMQPAEYISLTTGLPTTACGRLDGITLHRPALGHEWGHVRNWSRRTGPLNLRKDEGQADSFARRFCLARGDVASADFFAHWRVLHNFLGPVCKAADEPGADTSDYWHDLSATGLKVKTAEEYAAQLELKLLGYNLDPAKWPAKPAQFVKAAFAQLSPPKFMRELNAANPPAARLHQISSRHAGHPYKYRYSAALATRLLNAAGQLVPQAL